VFGADEKPKNTTLERRRWFGCVLLFGVRLHAYLLVTEVIRAT